MTECRSCIASSLDCGSCGSSLVSLEAFPQHKSCSSCRQMPYVTLFFISPFFFVSSIQNLKIWIQNLKICSLFLLFFPVFFCALYLFHPVLFYSSFYSLCCFLPLFIHFIFWSPLLFSFQICYPFFSLFLLLYSVCFSLMLYYYSICYFSISLHLFSSLYLILLCYLFCSCFCFLYIYFFFILSFSLFSSPLLSFCSFYAFFLILFLFFHFLFSSLLSFICYSCSYYWLTDFSCLFLLFIYLFIITIIFLVLYFVCIALLLLPTD